MYTMKKKERKKDKKLRKKKVFKTVQQNIIATEPTGYFASYYTPPTIRSRDYSEPRVIPTYNPYDMFGLESAYPLVASDAFIIQVPQQRIEPTRLRNMDRQTFNMARDIVPQHSPSQIPQEPMPVPELATEPKPKKTRGPYKKKVKIPES